MITRTLRFVVALSLLAMGALHLQQYLGAGYSSIPTIGVLFLLNAIGGAILGLALISPIRVVVRSGAAELATGLLGAAGAAMALASLVALAISKNGTLFGFHEAASGAPITVAIVAEVVAVISGACLAALCFRRLRSAARRARTAATWAHTPRSVTMGADSPASSRRAQFVRWQLRARAGVPDLLARCERAA